MSGRPSEPAPCLARFLVPLTARLLRRSARLLFAAALVWLLLHGVAQPRVALAFAVLIAVGESTRITLPGDRVQAPLATAAALGYALLGQPTTHGGPQVIAVAGLGTLGGALLGRLVHGRPMLAPEPVRRLLTVSFVAALLQSLHQDGPIHRLTPDGPGYGAFLVAVAALAMLGDALLAAVQRPWTGLRFGAALRDELRALAGVGSAVVAAGLLLALLATEVGLWALPLFCSPLLLAQASFRRVAAVRATTGQTIETLARVTEAAGYTPLGHARRVADTACALGRELGMDGRDLALLEYAALMHDIGQLSLVEPVPGGATALLPAEEQQRIARLGSEVISCAGVPGPVGEQVARLADPWRRPDGSCDSSLPLAARIIRVANAHEDLLTAARERGLSAPAGRLEALELLRLERDRAYDPVVIEALARVGRPGSGNELNGCAGSAPSGRRGWMRS